MVALGSFILTFNRPHFVEQYIAELKAQTRTPDLVLVVDNGDPGPTAEVIARAGEPWIEHAPTGDNLGAAGGTEFGARRLHERGCELIHFGDDDDPPRTPDTIERLVDRLTAAPPDVGAVGAVGAAWDWRRCELRRFADDELRAADGGELDVDMIGGNANLVVRNEVIDAVGPPDGRLFFSLDDLEFCLRIRQGGYRVLVDTDLMLQLRDYFGRLDHTEPRSLIPRPDERSIWRDYYSTRNLIFMMRRTFSRPDVARRAVVRGLGKAVMSWGKGLRYGSHYSALQLRAVGDGYRDRMGRTVEPYAKYASD